MDCGPAGPQLRVCHVAHLTCFQLETEYVNRVSEFDLGFSVGLVVGVGVFTAHEDQPALQIRLHRQDVDALDTLRHTLGGRVFGPYAHEGRHNYLYVLRGSDLREAVPLLDRHLPHSWRRLQFESWRSKHSDYLDRPRPSPALIDRMQRFLPTGHR